MTDNTLFDKDTSEPQVPESFEDLYVGEGKKYKDTTELNKAYWHLERHAEEIKKENSEARQKLTEMEVELKARKAVEEMLKDLQTKTAHDDESTQKVTNQDAEMSAEDKSPPVDIEKLVSSEIEKREKQREQSNNIAQANKFLAEKYGDKKNEVLTKVMEQTRMSSDELTTLAATRPEAFKALVSASEPQPVQKDNLLFVPPKSSVSTQNNNEADPRHKWAQIRKTNYKYYNSPEGQFARAKDLGLIS